MLNELEELGKPGDGLLGEEILSGARALLLAADRDLRVGDPPALERMGSYRILARDLLRRRQRDALKHALEEEAHLYPSLLVGGLGNVAEVEASERPNERNLDLADRGALLPADDGLVEVVEEALQRIAGARGIGRCQRTVAPGCCGRSRLDRSRGIGPSRRRREQDEREGKQHAQRVPACRMVADHITFPRAVGASGPGCCLVASTGCRLLTGQLCRPRALPASARGRPPNGSARPDRPDGGHSPRGRRYSVSREVGRPLIGDGRPCPERSVSGTLPAGGPRTSGGRPSRPPCS